MIGPADVLLRRRNLVAPDLMAAESQQVTPQRQVSAADGVAALEGELLQYGFLLSAELRQALAAMQVPDLAAAGTRLLRGAAARLGADVHHVPLFRKFPESVPSDTGDFFVRRVFTLLLQEPRRPCVLCGRTGTVHPVAPCAHLVCRSCWDGSDFSACPICHRRIDPADPFLIPTALNPTAGREHAARVATFGTTLLHLCRDPDAAARELAVSMLSRQTPMPADERGDLLALMDAYWPRSAGWLPEVIAVKETRAIALAAALTAPGTVRAAPRVARPDLGPAAELLARHLGTATDVLRLMYVLMGADPGVRTRPEQRVSLPRRLRRTLLGALDGFAMPYLIEDLHRHGEQWKRMAEVLHPHEHHARHPDAALAFAALRGTRLDPATAFGGALLERAAAHPELLAVRDGRLRVTTFGTHVERALAAKDGERALALLSRRPGELGRRLSQLLRLSPELVAGSLEPALRSIAPGVLMSALGQLRTQPGGTRLFLPRGGGARFHTRDDERAPLPEAAAGSAAELISGELLRRADGLPAVSCALLDEGLAALVAPTSERAATTSLVRLARGSVQPIPAEQVVRLFLHWAEPEGTRVDLDLSVAVFDTTWEFVGLCDYTSLRLGDDALVHSGDLTSAPEPLGSSEFVDLDVAKLAGMGGRYVVPVVFSYNDVPFELLVRGFAGFMRAPDGLFDPLAVRQRFDLTGAARILVPLVADLWAGTMRWAELNLSASGRFHSVASTSEELARVGRAMESAFGPGGQATDGRVTGGRVTDRRATDGQMAGGRVTLWEVACWHAAARAGTVLVRRGDSVLRFRRREDEPVGAFADRLTAGAGGVEHSGGLTGVDWAALVTGDVELDTGVQTYALYPGGLGEVRRMEAADLVGGLEAGT
ncbi:MXAN_6230/SCO0854 family RING domain-containing protein [Nonomuraea sp. NPDC059194]|uniref:MXAN_6230/SCO0854 family RING domain-containing protein n=1 Tax=Nonomuraea sp. NPDC059194 TaxID=3346764 RepID=UPI0036C79708